jgi:hypothetical protein
MRKTDDCTRLMSEEDKKPRRRKLDDEERRLWDQITQSVRPRCRPRRAYRRRPLKPVPRRLLLCLRPNRRRGLS